MKPTPHTNITSPPGPVTVTAAAAVFEPGQRVMHSNGQAHRVRFVFLDGVALEGVPNKVKPSELTILDAEPAAPDVELKAWKIKNVEAFRIATATAKATEKKLGECQADIEKTRTEREAMLTSRTNDNLDAAALAIATIGGREQLLKNRLDGAVENHATAQATARETARLVRGAVNGDLDTLRNVTWDVAGALRAAGSTSPASRLVGRLVELRQRADDAVGKDGDVMAAIELLDAMEFLTPHLREQLAATQQVIEKLKSSLADIEAEVDKALAAERSQI